MTDVPKDSAPLIKHDETKAPMYLLPLDALTHVADVMGFGAKKYGEDNWKTGKRPDVKRYLGAVLRHMEAYQRGERIDPESGLPHLAHLTCSALFALWMDTNLP